MGKPLLVTNIDPILLTTNVVTNVVYSLTPTNSDLQFPEVQLPRDRVTSMRIGMRQWAFTSTGLAQTPRRHTKVNYRVDGYFLDTGDSDYQNYVFPLQPGSDYATPPGGNDVAGVFQSATNDFTAPNGASGTLTFAAKKLTSQPILLNITDNNLTEFNEDIHLVIFEEEARTTTRRISAAWWTNAT